MVMWPRFQHDIRQRHNSPCYRGGHRLESEHILCMRLRSPSAVAGPHQRCTGTIRYRGASVRRQNLEPAFGEHVPRVGALDVAVERDRVVLGKDGDFIDTRMQAIADRNID